MYTDGLKNNSKINEFKQFLGIPLESISKNLIWFSPVIQVIYYSFWFDKKKHTSYNYLAVTKRQVWVLIGTDKNGTRSIYITGSPVYFCIIDVIISSNYNTIYLCENSHNTQKVNTVA